VLIGLLAYKPQLRPRVLAVAFAFFTRHGLRHGFRDFEISLLAAVLYAFISQRAALDHATIAIDTHGSRKRDFACSDVLME
jgi:hypothetical protein